MNTVEIQIQYLSTDGKMALGGWQTVRSAIGGDAQMVTDAMQQARRTYGGSKPVRIRAVDQKTGKVIDIL